MRNEYTFKDGNDLVVATFHDTVTDDEFLALYRQLYADPRYRLGMDEVADLRDVTLFDVSVDALHTVESIVRRRYGESDATFRTAIIAPADLSFGMGRTYEALISGGPENVFVSRTADKAIAWLGVDPAVLDG